MEDQYSVAFSFSPIIEQHSQANPPLYSRYRGVLPGFRGLVSAGICGVPKVYQGHQGVKGGH